MARGTIEHVDSGTLNIGIKLDVRGAIALGCVVYLAARAGTRHAIKKAGTDSNTVVNVFRNVTDEVKKQWSDTQPPDSEGQGPVVPPPSNGER